MNQKKQQNQRKNSPSCKIPMHKGAPTPQGGSNSGGLTKKDGTKSINVPKGNPSGENAVVWYAERVKVAMSQLFCLIEAVSRS